MINPYLELIISALILSTSGAFIKIIKLPATSISFYRFLIPVIITLAYFAYKKIKFLKDNNRVVLLASFMNAIRMFLYFVGFTYAPISVAAKIHYTWPVFAVIFSVMLLKEKLSRRNIFFICLAFVGIMLIYLNKDFSLKSGLFVGMAAMLLSAILNALATVLFKRVGERYSRTELVFYQNIAGVLLFIPFIFINPVPTSYQFSLTVIYVVLIGIIGYWLFFSALKKIKASTASFLAYLELIGSVAIGVVFFGDKLAFTTVVGAMLIIVSTLLFKKN